MKRLVYLFAFTSILMSCTYKGKEAVENENDELIPENVDPIENQIGEQIEEPRVSHEIWGDILMRYTNESGMVDYEGLKNNREDKIEMDKYMEILQQNHPDGTWSKPEEMAYWINTYNYFTFVKVLENYPISSVMDIDNKNMWDTKFIELGDTVYSLNQIEKDILLQKFGDARIHMAVNCASFSCPKIWRTHFDPEYLEDQLTEVTKIFVQDKERNKISGKKVELSKVFEWYVSDFEKDAGSVIEFINKYSDKPVKANAKITFMDYDWSLNDQTGEL